MSKPALLPDTEWRNLACNARGWLESPSGLLLQQEGSRLLDEALAPLFGSYQLTYGLTESDPPEAPQIRHHIRLGAALPGNHLFCEEQAWAVVENAADVVILHYGLDFSLGPHGLLREAARAVRPGGHLLIVGINPWSAWGVRKKMLFGLRGKVQSITHERVCDWLSLLGFALEKKQFGCYRPPLESLIWQQRLICLERWGNAWHLPGAGIYLLAARKLVSGLRPLPMMRRGAKGRLLPVSVTGRRSFEYSS